MNEASPRAILDDLLARAQEIRTPCGAGEMIWRVWGDMGSPALVLLHGGFGAWNHWVRNIPALEDRYRVIVPDLPGCGDSADPHEPYDAASLSAILSDGLDAALPADAPFDLVSFSFGGVLSGPIAQAQSGRIASLTIVGTPILGLTTTGPANELVSVPAELPPDEAAPLYRSNLQKLMVHYPDVIDGLAMTLHVENMAKTRLRSRGIARRTIAADALQNPPCRLNFIYGDGDVTLHPDMDTIRARVETIQPGAAFHVIPDTGHWVQFEAAARFNALLKQLLVQAG
ncbi:MAG: hypothetical protein CL566_06100 [Alphaproteobacteria bacterium]|nr:hypothetical protein [Alphaproteobacteria bacterium]